MADELGIVKRNKYDIEINVDRREENVENVSEVRKKSTALPEEVSIHIEHYHQSYYYKKYLAKCCDDPAMMFHVALQNWFKNKKDKVKKYFRLLLKTKQNANQSDVCEIFELKVLAEELINKKDLEDLKMLVESENHEKADRLLKLIVIHEDDDHYWVTNLEGVRKSLIEDLKNKVGSCTMPTSLDMASIIRGNMFVTMARNTKNIKKEDENNNESYYYLKYAAMCCHNLEAIRILQSLCTNEAKKEYYKSLYELKRVASYCIQF